MSWTGWAWALGVLGLVIGAGLVMAGSILVMLA